MNTEPSSTHSRRWGTPVALLLGAVIFTVFIAGYAWQNSERDSKLDEGAAHAAAAVHLQNASAEGAIAADLLRAYVAEGDETLIPRIQEQSTAGVTSLTQAIASSGTDEMRQLAVVGGGLAERAGTVIGLRQTGDVAGAAAALEELGPTFDDFGASLQSSIDTELREAASLGNSADDTERTAAWLLITALASGFATISVLLWVVGRSLWKRRAPESPSPA